jgi:hypothetical protein
LKRLTISTVAVMAALGITAVAFAGSSKTVYDTTLPNGPATNLPSEAFEAQSVSEFGGALTLPAGKSITSFTVTMSSWACQSGNWSDGTCTTASGATFSQPMTLNIYAADGTTSLATATQAFSIPYRPSSTAVSTAKCSGDNTAWYQPAQGHDASGCYHGVTSNVTFNLSGVNVPTDGQIVYGIAYQTRDYGLDGGSGVSGPADSLNVALNTLTTPPAGTGSIWLDSSWSGAYCDGGAVTGTFRADPGDGGSDSCWAPLVPAVKVVAS